MSSSTQPLVWRRATQQGQDKSVQQTSPAVIVSSLESALPRTTISCSQCRGPIVPAARGSKHSDLGAIKWLPRFEKLPKTSVIRQPGANVDEGAGDHPSLPAMLSDCGCLVFCLQMTSFGGRGIQKKYSNACDPRTAYESYLPLTEKDTPATNSKGTLDYEGKRLRNQSYV